MPPAPASGPMRLALAALLAAMPLAAACATYSEDFASGHAAGWVPVAGDWHVEDGQYSCEVHGGNPPIPTPLGEVNGHDQGLYQCLGLLPPNADWQDYEVRVQAFVIDDSPQHHWHAGIALRWLSPADSIVVRMGDDGLSIVRHVAGSTQVLAQARGSFPSEPDVALPFGLTARVEGARITASMSTGLRVEASDPAPDTQGVGQVGLLAYAEPDAVHVHFDDVQVCVLRSGPVGMLPVVPVPL